MINYISFCFNTYHSEDVVTIEIWLPYPPRDYICSSSIINGLVRAIFDILDWYFFALVENLSGKKDIIISRFVWHHQNYDVIKWKNSQKFENFGFSMQKNRQTTKLNHPENYQKCKIYSSSIILYQIIIDLSNLAVRK